LRPTPTPPLQMAILMVEVNPKIAILQRHLNISFLKFILIFFQVLSCFCQ
jgi:hypothetical protein